MLRLSVFTLFALIVAVLGSCFFTSSALAAYVLVNGARPVCFSEDIANANELIIFQYTRKQMQTTSDHKLRLTVSTPLSKTKYQDRVLSKHSQILTFPVYTVSGTAELGEYEICIALDDERGFFASNAKDLGILVEVLIDHRDRRKPLSSATDEKTAALRTHTDSGDEVFTFTDYDGSVKEALRTHDYIDRVSRHLIKIEGVINEVVSETRWFIERQSRMRQTSESSFSRVWGFSVLAIVALVFTSLIQFFSLRSFLMGKKLV